MAPAYRVEDSQDGSSLKDEKVVKDDAIETMRREICQAIKYLLAMRIVKEAEESGRQRAVREAIEKARGVIDKNNSI